MRARSRSAAAMSKSPSFADSAARFLYAPAVLRDWAAQPADRTCTREAVVVVPPLTRTAARRIAHALPDMGYARRKSVRLLRFGLGGWA